MSETLVDLLDYAISSLVPIISRQQALLFSEAFGPRRGRWLVWCSGSFQVVEQGGIWPEDQFGARRCRTLVLLIFLMLSSTAVEQEKDFFWRDLWDTNTYSWKDWQSLGHEYAPFALISPPLWSLLASFIRRIYSR